MGNAARQHQGETLGRKRQLGWRESGLASSIQLVLVRVCAALDGSYLFNNLFFIYLLLVGVDVRMSYFVL